MKITPFSKVYNRIRKRTTQKNSLAVSGFSGNSKGFSATKTKIRYFGRNSIDVPLAVKLRVYDKIMKKDLPSSFPCSPVANVADEVSTNLAGRNSIDVPLAVKLRVYDKIMKKDLPSSFSCSPVANVADEVSTNLAVVSAEEVVEELPSPAIAVPRPQARKKSRNRKIKSDDEFNDSDEVTVPKRIHVRGRTRRCQKNGNTSVSERGMLDSRTFEDYFSHLWNGFPKEIVKSVAYIEPLWFSFYASKERSHKVLNWVKAKGMLSKKSHWSLLIFCNLGESLQSKTKAPCMLLLDSLHAVGPKRLEPLIRRFLLDWYNKEERNVSKQEINKIPFLTPKVPQQIKGDECGYYVLQFINLFLKSAPKTFNTTQGCPTFMNKDWFTAEEMESFYKKLDSFKAASRNHGTSSSSDSSGCIELLEGPYNEVSNCVK